MSGYTHCACRDCMDPTVSNDTRKPELCSDCLDAGCDADSGSECARDDAYGGPRDGLAYGAEDPAKPDPIPSTVEAAILAVTGGADGMQVRLSVHHDSDGTAVWYATLYQWSRVSAGYAERLQGRGASLRLAVADLHTRRAIGADPAVRV